MKIRCMARKTGFWQDRLMYAADDWRNKRKGQADEFYLDERGLRYDDEGMLLVDEDFRPILPKWVKPLSEVPKVDPNKIPCQVIEAAQATKDQKRKKVRAAIADPEPEEKPDEITIPETIKKRGPGRPRKNDENVL